MRPTDRSRHGVRVEAATQSPELLRQRSLRQVSQVGPSCLRFFVSQRNIVGIEKVCRTPNSVKCIAADVVLPPTVEVQELRIG